MVHLQTALWRAVMISDSLNQHLKAPHVNVLALFSCAIKKVSDRWFHSDGFCSTQEEVFLPFIGNMHLFKFIHVLPLTLSAKEQQHSGRTAAIRDVPVFYNSPKSKEFSSQRYKPKQSKNRNQRKFGKSHLNFESIIKIVSDWLSGLCRSAIRNHGSQKFPNWAPHSHLLQHQHPTYPHRTLCMISNKYVLNVQLSNFWFR